MEDGRNDSPPIQYPSTIPLLTPAPKTKKRDRSSSPRSSSPQEQKKKPRTPLQSDSPPILAESDRPTESLS